MSFFYFFFYFFVNEIAVEMVLFLPVEVYQIVLQSLLQHALGEESIQP